MKNLNKLCAQRVNQKRKLPYLKKKLNALTKNLNEVSRANKEDFTIAVRNLSEATDSLNKILFRLENGRGTIGKLMTDEEVYNNLKEASVYARDFTYMLSKNPSLLLFKEEKNR